MYSAQTTLTYKKRKDKKIRNNNKLLIFIFLFFLLIAIIMFLNSSISRINKIEITGIHLLSEEDVFLQANISINMFYFLAGKSEIERNILELEQVKGVEVKKNFPGLLHINIIEKRPLVYINIDSRWVPILEDGQLYLKDYNDIYYGHPFVTKWDEPNLLKKLAEELTKTNSYVLAEISEIQQNPQEKNSDQLLLFTNEGYRLHISLNNLSSKLNLFPEVRDSIKLKTTKLGDIYLLESMHFEEFNY